MIKYVFIIIFYFIYLYNGDIVFHNFWQLYETTKLFYLVFYF